MNISYDNVKRWVNNGVISKKILNQLIFIYNIFINIRESLRKTKKRKRNRKIAKLKLKQL